MTGYRRSGGTGPAAGSRLASEAAEHRSHAVFGGGTPVVVHLVLTRLKPAATPEQLQRAIAALRALPGQVPGLLELDCGANVSPDRAQGYGFGLSARFASRADLAAYGPHPAHQAAAARLREVSEELAVLDFEV